MLLSDAFPAKWSRVDVSDAIIAMHAYVGDDLGRATKRYNTNIKFMSSTVRLRSLNRQITVTFCGGGRGRVRPDAYLKPMLIGQHYDLNLST